MYSLKWLSLVEESVERDQGGASQKTDKEMYLALTTPAQNTFKDIGHWR